MYTEDKSFDKAIEKNDKKLRILAHGDSWFAYPRHYGKSGNIIDCLDKTKKYKIRNLAKNGAELLTMISGKHNHKILQSVKRYYKKGLPYHIFLISGGGNDAVGKHDWEWLIKDKTIWEKDIQAGASAKKPETYIHIDRLNDKMKLIELGYKHIINQVSVESPGIKIIGQLYDRPFPSTKGFLPFTEAWMMPIMTKKKYGKLINADDEMLLRKIILKVFNTFKEMLVGVEKHFKTNSQVHFAVARTFGTFKKASKNNIAKERKYWRNEIHPTHKGFKLITESKIMPLIDKVKY